MRSPKSKVRQSNAFWKPEGKRGQIAATSYEPVDDLVYASAKGNIEALQNMGATVKGGVDARSISETLGKGGFDTIAWNFPHAKVPRQNTMRFHQNLLNDFFGSAKQVLKPGGKVYVTLVDSPHYRGWHIEEQAAAHGFTAVQTHQLPYEEFTAAYPGYRHKQTGRDESAFAQSGRPTITYVFQREAN